MRQIPVKYVARINAGQSPPSSEVSDLNDDLPFMQGNAEFGTVFPAPRFQCINPPKRARVGDILLSVRAPVGALNIADQDYGIGRGLCALTPVDCDGRFLWWWMHSQRSRLDSVSTGTTYRAVTAEDVAALPFPTLPQEEQRRIADFLDVEISRVDHIIGTRVKQRELLELRRWSYFEDSLRRFDPPVVPLRRFLSSITDGPFGSAFSSSDYVDEGAAVVRLGNIGFAEYHSREQARIPLALFERFRDYQVLPGDVLIAGLGDARNHAGRACVAPHLGPAIVKGKCFRARVEASKADPEFLALLLSSPIGASSVEARGSTRAMINLEIVKSALLPVPPLASQRLVAKDANEDWESTRRVLRVIDRQLNTLVERRTALITAAITGEIDVSTASGRGVDIA